MAQNGLLALLPPSYHAVVAKLAARDEVFGIKVDDSPVLRDLARLAWLIREEIAELARGIVTRQRDRAKILFPLPKGQKREGSFSVTLFRAPERIALLVLGNLAGTFTFNDRRLETGTELFPRTFGALETQRWLTGLRTPQAEDELLEFFPAFHEQGTIRLLSTQLKARIGDCAVYALTFGILVASVDIPHKVILVGKPPHAWVCSELPLSARPRVLRVHFDLATRSHGKLEDQAYYDAEFAEAPIKIEL